MRAVVMTAPGGPDVLQLVDLPEPELSSDHDVRPGDEVYLCDGGFGVGPDRQDRRRQGGNDVESPWEDDAIAAMHDRNLRVSFT
jgi:hypothetical protein